MSEKAKDQPIGRRVKVDRVTERYVPGGAEYWLTSADGEEAPELPEGTVLEVVAPENAKAAN